MIKVKKEEELTLSQLLLPLNYHGCQLLAVVATHLGGCDLTWFISVKLDEGSIKILLGTAKN